MAQRESVNSDDELRLRLERRSRTPLYRQIEVGVREAIAAGRLAPGSRLPPERTLAAALNVDRTTVVAAYRELAADGLVHAHVGRGTTVVATSERFPAEGRFGLAEGESVRPLDWRQIFAPMVEDDPALADIAALATREDVVSFVAGVPAPETYPTRTFRSLLAEALGPGGEGLLQYSPPEGYGPLREAIAARMARRGMAVSAGTVFICGGSQQGLYLLARALIEPGDTVAVEAPTYLGALQVFGAAGARLATIPADREGLDPDRLGEMLERRRVKLIYTLPTFQNPTGATLSLERRQRLLATARRHGVPVIEDDPYSELRYEGDSVPSLLALAEGPASPVVYLSTFSKVLFPGFRLGWVVAAPALIERLGWVKTLVDLESNPLAQWAVAAYLNRGELDSHLAGLAPIYAGRRDALEASLRHEAGEMLSWRSPAGGFYLWVHLMAGLRAREVLAEASREGVAFVPGDLFHADGGGRDALRLAFSGVSPAEISEGTRRLARAIRAVEERRAVARGRDAVRPPRIM